MLNKIAKSYLRIVEIICVVLLMIILICMCIQIGCRLFLIGQNFTEELARLCFSIMVFVGAPLALAEGSHIAVDMIVNIMPRKIKVATEIFDNILIALFSAFCVRSLVTLIGSNKDVRGVSMNWIHMSWLYYAFLISFIFMFIISIVKAVCIFRGKADVMDIHEKEKIEEREAEGEVDLGI